MLGSDTKRFGNFESTADHETTTGAIQNLWGVSDRPLPLLSNIV